MQPRPKKSVPRRAHKDSANERKHAHISPAEARRLEFAGPQTARKRTAAERQPRPQRSHIGR